jgi:cytoskeletal protein RodZ
MPILLPDQTDVAAFGEFLRRARERRGLSLQQIARETRIPWRHLDALEHGNLSAVPSGMYRRAEIRAYADAVGLDKGLALAHLEQIENAAPPSRSQDTPPPRRSATPGRRAAGAFAVVVIAMLATIPLWRPSATAPPAATPPPAAPVAAGPSASDAGVPASTHGDRPAVQDAALPAAEGSAAAATPTTSPATPPGTAAPVTGPVELVVTSEPSGARVLVDGVGWGTTPVTIRHLSPGPKRVRLVKEGFVSDERAVRVARGQPGTVSVALKPAGSP